MENIDTLKRTVSGQPRYRLANANVFVSGGGFHFIDYMDPVDEISPEINASELTEEQTRYIEKSLQSNAERFENQVRTVNQYCPAKDKTVLDIGCGGGLFLSKMKACSAAVTGIELSDARAQYAKVQHGLKIHKRPIEAEFWQSDNADHYDVVTLWDVIEHVNYPLTTLKHAANLLKSGGFLFIDTPCRDSFYHRCGELTYRLTNGRFPTFLNAMYSAHRFGHKQIFSTAEIRELYEQAGLEVVELEKFHELSFPYSFYLKKILRSDLLVKMSLPFVHAFLTVFPVKNKMLAVGRKR